MSTLVFVLFWVILGLGLLLIALSGGPSGALNVYVRGLRPLSAPASAGAEVVALHERAAREAVPAGALAAAGEGAGAREPADGALADFRGVAPAVQSFAAGRRR